MPTFTIFNFQFANVVATKDLVHDFKAIYNIILISANTVFVLLSSHPKIGTQSVFLKYHDFNHISRHNSRYFETLTALVRLLERILLILFVYL